MKILVYVIFLLFLSYGVAANNVKPQSIERAMECIHSNNPSEAIKILSEYQPSAKELPLYHFAYAKAFELSKRHYDSIARFRLAYLYSQQDEMKEIALLKRAEAYGKIEYYSEAILSFRIFLKNFPHSQYAEQAFLGLADSLFRLGFFSEAKEAYEKAGNSSRALYGKANALHAMGKVKDANKIYMAMIDRDRGYVESSQETLYNIGENFRLMGESPTAEIYLNSITALPVKYRAYRSLGLIEVAKAHFNIAIRFFHSALRSPEKQLRRLALINLADVYIKQGRYEDAKSRLLEVRNKYPYGREYDEALLMLSQLYKKEGNFKDAISLIKELVFRHSPDKNALDEFETIILEAEEKGGEEFYRLWRAAGHWLLQPSRSQSLLKIAKGLRHSGKPYLEICTWLSKHGSDDVKPESNLLLADFYADLGDTVSAAKYLQGINIKGNNDEILRIKAKIYRVNADYQKAAKAILGIKEIKQDELAFLAGLLESVGNDYKVMGFFEGALHKSDAPPWAYVKLADMLYETGRKSDALKYYKTAVSLQQKGIEMTTNDLEWAFYRISVLSEREDSQNALRSLQKNKDTLSRLSVLLLKESNITEKINWMF